MSQVGGRWGFLAKKFTYQRDNFDWIEKTYQTGINSININSNLPRQLLFLMDLKAGKWALNDPKTRFQTIRPLVSNRVYLYRRVKIFHDYTVPSYMHTYYTPFDWLGPLLFLSSKWGI
jgi:hypothetical protein